MSNQSLIIPAFVVIQAKFLLRAFEGSFHAPATERRQQQVVKRHIHRCIAHKIFDLFFLFVHHVSRDDQSQRLVSSAEIRAQSAEMFFTLHSPLCVLHLFHQSRPGAFSPVFFRLHCCFRQVRPGIKRAGDFADQQLIALVELSQKYCLAGVPARLATVSFIECEVLKHNAVFDGAILLLQRDLPLGTIHKVIGYPCRATTFTVVRPCIRQEQILVDERVKVVDGISEMHGDDAVFMLRLRASGRNGKSEARSLKSASFGMFSGMLFGDDFLQLGSHPLVIPNLLVEKPLHRPHRHPGLQRDRLTIFPRQVGHQPTCVKPKIIPRPLVRRTRLEAFEKQGQFGLDFANIK